MQSVTPLLGIAPSGELFAFAGPDGIYLRRMKDVDAHLIAGTPGGTADLAVSPDGREIAFFRGPPGQLFKVAVDGGAPVVLIGSVRRLRGG